MVYTDDQGKQSRPIMLHRALLGSLERFIGTLIEHYAGNFPLWLAPVQVVLIPIKSAHEPFALNVKARLQAQNLRVIMDSSNETLGKRIREATLKKIPYLLIVGDKEIENNQISVRKRSVDTGSMTIDALVSHLNQEIVDKK